MNSNIAIRIRKLSLGYGDSIVLRDIDLDILERERLCITGASGQGKTTLLNAIAGLHSQTRSAFQTGEIDFPNLGRKISKVGIPRISFVFQDLALFPHLNVWQNVAFPLQIAKVPIGEIGRRVDEMLCFLAISDKKKSNVSDLSGGQRQRVALGRALILEPDILCMDEPMRGLDPVLKEDLIQYLLDLQKTQGFNLIYVTHDREETFRIAERIVFIESGIVTQHDTPAVIYSYPNSQSIAKFIGPCNFILLDASKISLVEIIVPTIKSNPQIAYQLRGGILCFRPEHVAIHDSKMFELPHQHQNDLYLYGKVGSSIFTGARYTNTIIVSDDFVIICYTMERIKDQHLQLRIPMDRILIFDSVGVRVNV